MMLRTKYVPTLRYHMFSLTALIKKDQEFAGVRGRTSVSLKSKRSLLFPLNRSLHQLYGYRPDNSVEPACAVIVPARKPAKLTAVNINIFYCAQGHTHEILLRKTAGKQGVTLTGKLYKCTGCSFAEGYRNGVEWSTQSRVAKRLDRVFIDLSRANKIVSIGENKFIITVRNDCSQFSYV